MVVGQQMTCTCTATDCTGAQFTLGGTWSSSNTSVMTVDSSSGLVTGVSAGTATISVDLGFISEGTGCIPNGCPQGHPVPNTGGTVVPTISQSQNLWWFGNGNTPPSGFNLGGVTATLTANGAGNGTYVWTITNGTTRLVLENNSTTITKTNANTVGISSTGYSLQANDVTVQLQFTPTGGSAVTTSYSLGIDSPYKLVSTGVTTNRGVTGDCLVPASGTDGFQSLVPYKILSFFSVQISNIGLNESFATWADDYIGNN